MLLYKNVDICDLKSIMENGILSLDECGNNNWMQGNRADNDTSVVYLFSPINNVNTFPCYGVALLEVECNAKENAVSDYDSHKNDYKEYIIDKVLPTQIKRIIIPKIFAPFITVPAGIEITWCNIRAEYYDDVTRKKCGERIMKQFAETAELMDSKQYNFFRGTDSNGYVVDLYNVEYIF